MTPAVLIFLFDQALVQEVRAPYGGYPLPAVLGVGLAWLVGTLVIAIVIDRLPTKGRRGK